LATNDDKLLFTGYAARSPQDVIKLLLLH
jgi:hypothetical protein